MTDFSLADSLIAHCLALIIAFIRSPQIMLAMGECNPLPTVLGTAEPLTACVGVNYSVDPEGPDWRK